MLANGETIFYDKTIRSYDYYHVETASHSVISADGMLTESYLETGDRASFHQEGKVAALRGAAPYTWEENAAAPLCVERSFVEPLFRTLEERKAKVSGQSAQPKKEVTTTDFPDLRLMTDAGATLYPVRQTAERYSFMLPPDTRFVRILSRASRPADVIGPFVDDRRSMGVAVGDVHLLCDGCSHDITAHLLDEKPKGWHVSENAECAWTNGNAILPLGDQASRGKVGMLSIIILASGPYLVVEQDPENLQARSA